MGLLDSLFKKDQKDKHNLPSEYIKIRELTIFLSGLTDKSHYVSKSEYINKLSEYDETVQFFTTLQKSGMLNEYCKKNGISSEVVELGIKSYSLFSEIIDKYNDEFIKQELISEKDYLDNILKDVDPVISLDDNQRRVVLTDEDYCLVIAGAGAGKTTTVAAKAKYLVEKQNVDPREILIISFTNKAVGELRDKINKDLNIPCTISTFHSIGYAIMSNAQEKQTIISENKLFNILNDYFKSAVLSNPVMVSKLVLFFSTYFNAPQGEDLESFLYNLSKSNYTSLKFDITDNTHSVQNPDSKRMITLRNEIMRSYQEVQIANFLFLNNVDYVYEEVYPYSIKDSVKPYTPDFTLHQNGKTLYLEHFGINENGTSSRYDKQTITKYKKSINDKVTLHKEHGTELIYTFSGYNDKCDLLTHLESELIKHGFELNRRSDQEVLSKIIDTNNTKYTFRLIALISRFINLFKTNGYTIDKFKEMSDSTPNVRNKLFLDIAKECYLEYEKYLKVNSIIDFQDMINISAKMLIDMKDGKEKLRFKYVIVDEYQDISRQRFDLVSAIHEVCDAKVVAVGDDWQSIYAFSGSDISLFTQFEKKMGYAKMLKIENTYRNAQEIIDIAGNFVLKNDVQIRKTLHSPKHITDPIIIHTYDPSKKGVKENNKSGANYNIAKAVEKALDDIRLYEENDGKECKNVLLLGRYNFDIRNLENSGLFEMQERGNSIKSLKYPKYKIVFMTAHASKGLGYDNVIIINGSDGTFGFPSKIDDDPVLKFVKIEDNSYAYAEERRLFYVAMTRTKNRVYCIAPEMYPSEFLKEIKRDYEKVILKGHWDETKRIKSYRNECPICSYPLQYKANRQGLKLWICKNEPEICGFMTNDLIGGKLQVIKCDECQNGYLIVKRSQGKEPFLGCTNYKADGTGCNKVMAKGYFYKLSGIQDDISVATKTIDFSHRDFAINLDKAIDFGNSKQSINRDPELEEIAKKCRTIISCVDVLSQKKYYTPIQISKILLGITKPSQHDADYTSLKEYGSMSGLYIREIEAIIVWLVNHKYLTLTKTRIPVLHPAIASKEFNKNITVGNLKELRQIIKEINEKTDAQ